MTKEENERKIEFERQYIEKYREPIKDFLEFSAKLEGKLTDNAMFYINHAREQLPSMLEKGNLFISNTAGHICAGLNSERDINNPQEYSMNSERHNLITETIRYLTKIATAHKKAKSSKLEDK